MLSRIFITDGLFVYNLSDNNYLIDQLVIWNKMSYQLSIYGHFSTLKNVQTFAGSSFSNVRIYCRSLLFMTVNKSLWVWGCWFDKRSILKMSLWALGKCDDHYRSIF